MPQMIDVNVAIRTWLLLNQLAVPGGIKINEIPILLHQFYVANSVAGNGTPDRVYAGHLIPGFDPQFGPGMVIRIGSGATAGTGGGSAHPEIPLIMPRMQLTVFAGEQQYDIARLLYRAAFDWIQGMTNVELGNDDQGNHIGYVMSCLEATEGQDVDDPHTHTATNLSYWKLMLRQT